MSFLPLIRTPPSPLDHARQIPNPPISFSLSSCKPDVAPTYAHSRQQPPALSRSPPRGLGRGRVCSIDRRRSAKLAERDRAPSWRRTPRISSFACHPLFRKSSYPLLDLPSSLSPSRRITLAVSRRRAAPRRVLVRVSRSCLSAATAEFEREKKAAVAGTLTFRNRRSRWTRIRECDGIAIESSRRKSRPPTS